MRLLLLPVVESLPELLPPGTRLDDVLSGRAFQYQLAGSLTLHFQDTPLESQHNGLASQLSGLLVRGDAVVGLSRVSSDAESSKVIERLASSGKKRKTAGVAASAPAAEAEAPGAAVAFAEAPCPGASPDWASLQPELLAELVKAAGHSCTFARMATQVCGSWRSGLLRDQSALQSLHFACLRPVAGQAGVESRCMPALVSQASAAGNVLAALVAARWLHEAGDSDAVKHWQQAAKHPEAQYGLGFASYKGAHNLPQDSDKAFMFLSRALRQLSAKPLVLPPLMAVEDCQRLLGRSACILAMMHLDGEATAQSTENAIRLLKLAVESGCADSALLLGSLVNSGQYA